MELPLKTEEGCTEANDDANEEHDYTQEHPGSLRLSTFTFADSREVFHLGLQQQLLSFLRRVDLLRVGALVFKEAQLNDVVALLLRIQTHQLHAVFELELFLLEREVVVFVSVNQLAAIGEIEHQRSDAFFVGQNLNGFDLAALEDVQGLALAGLLADERHLAWRGFGHAAVDFFDEFGATVLRDEVLLVLVVVSVHLQRELEACDLLRVLADVQLMRHRELLLQVSHQAEVGQVGPLDHLPSIFSGARAGCGQRMDAHRVVAVKSEVIRDRRHQTFNW